jgi:hypothetical protein
MTRPWRGLGVTLGRWTLALALCALLSAVIPLSSSATTVKRTTPSSPCGAPGPVHYDHVVWIMLENVGYAVVGSPNAPYFNQLASSCGLATNYDAISHPSLPNYVALTSGSTQNITDDGEPSEHPLSVPSIFSQLGSNWRTLAESMPSNCDRVTSGTYAARHNPAVYYTNITASCRRNDVPFKLPMNLNARFTMIVPNICDDMHSCSESVGDAWLRRMVPLILGSSLYTSRSLALFITFDENDGDANNQVPTLVIAPSVPHGARVGDKFTHYSLLRTTETLLHLPLLGAARTAAPMIGPFRLAGE